MCQAMKIPDAELEIMMVIWDAPGAVNSDYIMEKLHKSWTKPTLLKLLSRLYDRGFVSFYKEGKFKMYSPKIAKEDYVRSTGRRFFKKMNFGSLTSLVASLYDGGTVTKEDLTELEEYIKEITG